MDNELRELEAELKRLRPLAPSPELHAKLEREFAAPHRLIHFVTWASLPLAAAVAGLLVVPQSGNIPVKNAAIARAESPVAPSPMVAADSTPAYKPVSVENLLYAQRDDGVVTLADGTTARRVRSSYVDTITWRNPRTQASLRWSVPRTEEQVIPVSFQ